ncbi:hypothetical protein DFH07DRAFT_966736 [Mycena maculata]|uniref:Uncharacterized protein n=1 Tax=Mycena maculata TaxID=230809 RepID=A0AAD7I8R8_9AGAR|nr:hypothetical protein DFH07DRAFT_966736 [Mycena maculata]
MCFGTPGVLGLVPFAEHCPNLRSLTIFVDATAGVPTKDTFFRIKKTGISNPNLSHLDVGNSPIKRETVAVSSSFIAMLFPKLQSISAVNEETKELWAQVMQLVPTLTSVYAGYEEFLTSSPTTQ